MNSESEAQDWPEDKDSQNVSVNEIASGRNVYQNQQTFNGSVGNQTFNGRSGFDPQFAATYDLKNQLGMAYTEAEDENVLPQDICTSDQINLYYIRNQLPNDIKGDLTHMGTLRKLELCGKDTKHKFCFPRDLNKCLENPKKQLRLQKMSLFRITCSLYDAINSI